MEDQESKSQRLVTAIDMLEPKESKFINWYVWACLRYGNFYSFDIGDGVYIPNRENVYLPYAGGNVDVVVSLFEAVQKLKYPGVESTEQEIGIVRKLAEKWIEKKIPRGTILCGPVGCGKTTLLLEWLEFRIKVLAPHPGEINRLDYGKCRRIRRKKILVLSPDVLRARFYREEFELWQNISEDIVFVDDIGLIPTINHFGRDIQLLEELIYSQYDRFKYNELELFGTTNRLPEELKEDLNLRAFSRLHEMADLEMMTGEDRRKNPEKCLKAWPKFKDMKDSRDDWCER